MKRHFARFPITNDAEDLGSMKEAIEIQSFLSRVKNSMKEVIAYGIIGSTDLNCDPATIDGDWKYKGSQLDNFITSTNGVTLSLCDGTFGNSLAKITDNLNKRILNPRIPLDRRPLVASIKISYKGEQLPGGPKEQGGYWYYSQEDNAVIFYDLSFDSMDCQYRQ